MIRVRVQLDRGPFALGVDIESNERVTGVFGPSGAGKSTLIRLIAGLERPDQGLIEANGRTLFDSGGGIDLPTHRRGVGVVFQEHRLFPHLSVRGNLLYGQPGARRSGIADESRRIIELLELGGLLERSVSQISGGECQRVALGRALISRPALLLLDEPLASLDRRLKRQILPYLKRVCVEAAIPILCVSHDLTELLQLTDQLVVLERGRLVGQGRYADLVHDRAVLEVVHDRGMQNVLAATVVEDKPEEGVSVLQLGSGDDAQARLIVPRCSATPGARVTIGIHPWDVALAAEPAASVSIRNQIRGTVSRCTLHETRAVVEVDIGVGLIVEVSRRSAISMNLEVGRPIVCLIKSNAIQVVDGG